MQGNRFYHNVHLGGTLAANQSGRIHLHQAATLQAVLASAENNSDATLVFGTVADPDGIFTAAVIGDSKAAVTFNNASFTGALFTGAVGVDYLSFAAGTVLEWTLDFDGAAGTAAANVDLQFVFDEA